MDDSKDNSIRPMPNHSVWAKIREFFKDYLLFFLIFGIFALASMIYKIWMGENILIAIYDILREIYRTYTFYSVLFFLCIIVGIQLFCLPLQSIFEVMISFIVGNFWISWPICFSSILIGGVGCYVIGKFICGGYVKNNFNKTVISRHFSEMIKCYSWQTAMAIRFTLLPSGIVNYSLLSIECPCLCYFLPMWAFYGMYNVLTNLIGCNLTSFAELLDSDGWSSLSTTEQIEYLFVICSFVLSTIVLFIIHYKSRKHMQKIVSIGQRPQKKDLNNEEHQRLSTLANLDKNHKENSDTHQHEKNEDNL